MVRINKTFQVDHATVDDYVDVLRIQTMVHLQCGDYFRLDIGIARSFF